MLQMTDHSCYLNLGSKLNKICNKDPQNFFGILFKYFCGYFVLFSKSLELNVVLEQAVILGETC